MKDGNNPLRLERDVDHLYQMLKLVRTIEENQPIGIIKLSEIFDLPNHKVRYMLRLLESDGIISPSANGCVLNIGYDDYIDRQVQALRKVRGRIDDILDEISEKDQDGARCRLHGFVSKIFYSDFRYWHSSGLAGALGVPYTRNRQYAGATAGDGPAELPSP